MAVAVTLSIISSGYNLTKLNSNFTALSTALQDAVSRSANSPNTLTADLDMNSQQLINLGAPTIGGHAVTKTYGDANYGGTAATNAAASAAAALVSELAAAADLVLTNADVVSTNADVVSTNADVVSTNADVVLTAVDVVSADASAAAVGSKFTFDSTITMADPGTGDFRFNNATVSSVTNIAFDATSADTGNPDVSSFIATWDDSTNGTAGHIIFKKSSTPATFAIFAITGTVTDNTGWLQIAVTHVSSGGTWSAADTAYVQFIRAGDSGSGYGDLLAVNNLSDVASVATSRTNLGLAIGTDVQAYDATIMVDADIGSTVQADLDVVSQVDAEAGTATDERVWTAVRVKQAIAALAGGGGEETFLFSSGTMSGASSASGFWTADSYDAILVNFIDVDRSADGGFRLTVSTNGSTYHTGATDYYDNSIAGGTAAYMPTNTIIGGTVANEYAQFTLGIMGPESGLARRLTFIERGTAFSTTAGLPSQTDILFANDFRLNTTDIVGLNVELDTGTMSGTIIVTGLKHPRS